MRKKHIIFGKILLRSYQRKQKVNLHNLGFMTNKELVFENLIMKIKNAGNDKLFVEYEYFIKIYEGGSILLKVNYISKSFKIL